MRYCVGDRSVVGIHKAIDGRDELIDRLGAIWDRRWFVDRLRSEGGGGWGHKHGGCS